MKQIICLTEEEIKSQIDYSRQKQSIFFQEKQLYLGSIFPKNSFSEVSKFCEKYVRKKLQCLLIENETSLTIWVEKNTPTTLQNNLISADSIIACIDDSQTIQYSVNMILSPLGYQVLNIIKPTSQWKILLVRKPKLIFLDVNMPDINGFQLCEHLKKFDQTKDIPIVMLTGNTSPLDRVRAKFKGADQYITKPFTPQQLIDAVQTIVTI